MQALYKRAAQPSTGRTKIPETPKWPNRITNIQIGNYKLSGMIPVEIPNLSFLRRLKFQNNSFSGPLPPSTSRNSRSSSSTATASPPSRPISFPAKLTNQKPTFFRFFIATEGVRIASQKEGALQRARLLLIDGPDRRSQRASSQNKGKGGNKQEKRKKDKREMRKMAFDSLVQWTPQLTA